MPMNETYLNAIANAGKALITHIGLVNASDVELSGGGYARISLASVGGWTAASAGLVRPAANMVFTTEAGDVVAGWKGFSAAVAGTDYGGEALTQVTFSNPGTYTLLAAGTGIDHDAV